MQPCGHCVTSAGSLVLRLLGVVNRAGLHGPKANQMAHAVCPHGLPTVFGFRPMQSQDVDSGINAHVLTVGYAIVIVKQPKGQPNVGSLVPLRPQAQ